MGDAAQPDEPVGRVIDAARHAGSVSALFEIALAALPGDLRLGAADGPRIAVARRCPIPFSPSKRAPDERLPNARLLSARLLSARLRPNPWKVISGSCRRPRRTRRPRRRNRHGQRAQDRDAQGGRPLARRAGGQRPQRGQTGDGRTVTVQINGPVGVTAATARGKAAPPAKQAADATAACTGRARLCSRMPSSSRACASSAS